MVFYDSDNFARFCAKRANLFKFNKTGGCSGTVSCGLTVIATGTLGHICGITVNRLSVCIIQQ